MLRSETVEAGFASFTGMTAAVGNRNYFDVTLPSPRVARATRTSEAVTAGGVGWVVIPDSRLIGRQLVWRTRMRASKTATLTKYFEGMTVGNESTTGLNPVGTEWGDVVYSARIVAFTSTQPRFAPLFTSTLVGVGEWVEIEQGTIQIVG